MTESLIELPDDVRLVATDLDGTLLRADDTIGERTAHAVRALAEAGVDLVFVTGRPPRWLPTVAEASGHRGTAICANGAVVADLRDEVIESVSPLASSAAAAAVQVLRGLDSDVTFAVEFVSPGQSLLAGGMALGDDYVPRWEPPAGLLRAPVEELVARPDVVKLLARAPAGRGHDADDFLAAAVAGLDGLVEVTHSDSANVLLELSARGVDKGSALAALAAARGYTREQVVAVGDMPNDVPMIRWAGTGFAVGNAHPWVVDAASGTLAHHDDEGVADLLEAIARSVR